MYTQRRKPSRSNRARTGAALVEFAICMPVFFLITMATIETCRMLYLRQSLKIAAYECARLSIVPGVQAADVQAQCDVFLTGRKIKNYQLTSDPPDPQSLSYGDLLTMTVEVPAEENALIGSWFYSGKDFAESVTIMAEN